MTQRENPLERVSQPSVDAVDAQTSPGLADINKNVAATSGHSNVQADTASNANTSDSARSEASERTTDQRAKLPPPSYHRPDTVVRAVGPDARVEMERGSDVRNEPHFTKGHNAPTADQSRSRYSLEQMDAYLTDSRRGIFPDTPGGAGATPLSADRDTFIADVARIGHFPSRSEAEKWTRGVFNALRHRAVEVDNDLASDLASMVRVGESPVVQVEEMMWGGDFADRYSRMVCLLQTWTRQDFYKQVAQAVGSPVDDPWIDASVYSFFGALKRVLGDDADRAVSNLGEMQAVWERA